MAVDLDLRELLRAVRKFSRSPAEGIQRQLEGDLERAARLVREGKSRVARQRQIVRWQRTHNTDSALAEALLETFEDALAHQRHCLQKLRDQDGPAQRR